MLVHDDVSDVLHVDQPWWQVRDLLGVVFFSLTGVNKFKIFRSVRTGVTKLTDRDRNRTAFLSLAKRTSNPETGWLDTPC